MRSFIPAAAALILATGLVHPLGAQDAEEQGPTDPEIAHIAVTANAIDVEMGRLALTRAESPAVRDFARTMIADHSAVNEQAAELAERLGVTPADNPTSQSLQENAAEARDELESVGDRDFARAYIEREIAYHRTVLSALDEVLIPGADSAELREFLEAVRPAIAGHLEHAESIRESMNDGGDNGNG